MDITADEFVEENPHFAKVDKSLIAMRLAYAKTQVSQSLFSEDEWRFAVTMLASHLLSLSPRGHGSRLDPDDGRTTYLAEYERLVTVKTAGPRVL